MNEPPNNKSPDFLPILGIVLGTLVFIVAFVLLLYVLYTWLGPWGASIVLVLLLGVVFYGGLRLWQRMGEEIGRSTEENVKDAD
ncbi:MAG: hypothetical protein ACP5HM_14750 [Anaerolineae bacterium]